MPNFPSHFHGSGSWLMSIDFLSLRRKFNFYCLINWQFLFTYTNTIAQLKHPLRWCVLPLWLHLQSIVERVKNPSTKSNQKSKVMYISFFFFFAVVLCSPPDTGGLVLLLQCADVTLCFLDLSHCLVASLKAGVRLHFSSNSKMKMLYNLQWTLDCEKWEFPRFVQTQQFW